MVQLGMAEWWSSGSGDIFGSTRGRMGEKTRRGAREGVSRKEASREEGAKCGFFDQVGKINRHGKGRESVDGV